MLIKQNYVKYSICNLIQTILSTSFIYSVYPYRYLLDMAMLQK